MGRDNRSVVNNVVNKAILEIANHLITLKKVVGGGGGIRTHGRLSPTSVFKTGAFNHSATPPTGRPIQAMV